MPQNIFGPGHHVTTNPIAVRPTHGGTALGARYWFAQCLADGTGGTNIDALWLNTLLAEFRKCIDSTGVTESETAEDLLAEAMGRYASGAVFGVDTGVANAYVVNTSLNFVMPKALFLGQRILFKPANGNTGAATLNAWGLGVKALRNYNDTALTNGLIVAGRQIEAYYDPSANSGAGAWLIAPWCFPPDTTQVTLARATIDLAAIGSLSFSTFATHNLSYNAGLSFNLAPTMGANSFTLPTGVYVFAVAGATYQNNVNNTTQTAHQLRITKNGVEVAKTFETTHLLAGQNVNVKHNLTAVLDTLNTDVWALQSQVGTTFAGDFNAANAEAGQLRILRVAY